MTYNHTYYNEYMLEGPIAYHCVIQRVQIPRENPSMYIVSLLLSCLPFNNPVATYNLVSESGLSICFWLYKTALTPTQWFCSCHTLTY